jgi:hypothetical protein
MMPTYDHLRSRFQLPPRTTAALALWAIAVGVGWAMMTDYEFRGFDQASKAVAQWPVGLVERSLNRPTLVMCLHPKCPCSQATLSELERLLARPAVAAMRPVVLAVMTLPTDADGTWTNTLLIDRCRRLPEVRVELDRGGRIAAAFGAATSGEVLLFDAAGGLQFAGGVTVSRGHEGTSAGSDALAALLAGTPTATVSTPVFGCRLVAPATGEQCQPDSDPSTIPRLVAGTAPREVEVAASVRAVVPISDPASTPGE